MKFSLEEDDFQINFQSSAVTTDEVLAHFVQFMLGCGYAQESIYAGMQECIDEHKFFETVLDIKSQDKPSDLD